MSATRTSSTTAKSKTEMINFLRDARRRLGFGDAPKCDMMCVSMKGPTNSYSEEELVFGVKEFAIVFAHNIKGIRVEELERLDTEGDIHTDTFYICDNGKLRWMLMSVSNIREGIRTVRHYMAVYLTPTIHPELFSNSHKTPKMFIYHEISETVALPDKLLTRGLNAFREACEELTKEYKKLNSRSPGMSIEELTAALEDKPKPKPKPKKPTAQSPRCIGGAGAASPPSSLPCTEAEKMAHWMSVADKNRMNHELKDEDPCNPDE